MKRFSTILIAFLLYSSAMSITGPQGNEPVKSCIEKIAESPPGIVATYPVEIGDNPVYVMQGDFRLISDYETTGTPSKPLALVMAPTTSVATDYSVLMNRSLFLPQNINQVEESPPV